MTSAARQIGWRGHLGAFLDLPWVQKTLIWIIVLNAITLGLETDRDIMARWGVWLVALDHVILGIFVVEIAARLAVHRLAFFRDPWSVFDFLVVGIALIPASGPFAVLRALRVLRVLRLITMVPNMRRVVAGLLSAIPGLSSVLAIIALLFYVFAVMATKLYGQRFPEWFGSLGDSAYTLFQIMTLESWSMGIVRPVMEVYPYSWFFFVVFILVSTFTMLNLFIAVIVNAIQSEHHREAVHTEEVLTARIDEEQRDLLRELGAVRRELAELRQAIDIPEEKERVRQL